MVHPLPAWSRNPEPLRPPYCPPSHPTLSVYFEMKWQREKTFIFMWEKPHKAFILLISVWNSSLECFLHSRFVVDLINWISFLDLVPAPCPAHLFCSNLLVHLLTSVTSEKNHHPIYIESSSARVCIIALMGMAWFPPRCSLSADSIVF
jgi:hypothetical protein